jgi:hypothetical protein
MKKTITLTTLILAGLTANAECCVVQCQPPKPKVITKTKVVEKVVEKPVEKIVEKPVVVEKEVIKVVDRPVPVRVKETIIKKVQKKNRVSALVGMGPTRLSVTQTEARLERGGVVGVQYQRMIGEDLSIGVIVQSNETVMGSIGVDF